MSVVTAETPSVQQDFVEDVRARSLFAPLPIIAGGDDVAAEAAGAGQDASTPSPGQGGSGESAKGEGGFNWGNFPDVPEEQRALLEPHLKNVQGHVTKLEEQYAPFKQLPQGMTPETLQGYSQLDQEFAKDPIGTWVRMGQTMQESGDLSDELDFEALQSILNGEEDKPSDATAEPGTDGEQDIDPRLAAALEKIDQLEGRFSQEDQAKQQAEQDKLLDENLSGMRTKLTEAGIDAELLTDELLIGQLMATRGDADKATQTISGFREGSLKGFTEKARQEKTGKDLKLPNGTPKAPEKSRGDSWGDAKAGAKHMLETLNSQGS